MHVIHWLFIVSVALFVSGIGLVIAGARAAREAPPAAAAVLTLTPVASVRQIMRGIVGPAAAVVFNSVSTTVTIKGTEEKAPQTDKEWEEVGNAAAALIESGNLLLIGSRAVDKGDWLKYSEALIEGGKAALKAMQAKSADQLLETGEAINGSCDNCHQKYRRGE